MHEVKKKIRTIFLNNFFYDRNFINSKGYGCKAYDNHEECDLYMGWMNRNAAKRNIMNTAKLELDVQTDNSVEEIVDRKYIYELVDGSLSVQHREDWIRFTNNLKLPKARKEIIVEAVLKILKENDINHEQETR